MKQKYTSNIKNIPFLFLEMKRNKQSQRHEAEIDNLKTTINETDSAREKAALQKKSNTIQAAFDECRRCDQIIAYIAH